MGGRQRAAMITGPEQQLCARARLSGFQFALEMAGIEQRPELVRWGTFHPETGRALGLVVRGSTAPPIGAV